VTHTPVLLLAAVPVVRQQLLRALALQGRVVGHVRLRVENLERRILRRARRRTPRVVGPRPAEEAL